MRKARLFEIERVPIHLTFYRTWKDPLRRIHVGNFEAISKHRERVKEYVG